MTRRTVSDCERAEFEHAFREARPLKPATAEPHPPRAVKSHAPSGVDGATARRMRQGTLEPQARLDLHGMTEDGAHRALATFLRGAQARGLRLVIVVTGKGRLDPDAPFEMGTDRRGVLKQAAPRWLREPEFSRFIADLRPAHRRHGGEGALYVYLRKKPA
ncbi:MAG TPA: Smr/MutS family protein [Rhizomicrobium sp.]|nr:Smr/MutS family protein [Rhizomicrobium sp.]